MLEIKNLSFGYIKQPLCIIDLSLKLNNGESLLVLGGDGMGKTSLLKVICGLEKQYVGGIFIDNKELKDISNNQKNISFLPKDPVLLNGSIKKNLDFLFKTNNVFLEESEIIKIFELFNFKHTFDEKIKKLSLADKKIFTIIRAYIKSAKLVLVDNLLENETEENIVKIKNALNLLFELNKNNKVMIAVENLFDEFKFDKILYLSYSKNIFIENIKSLEFNPIDYYSVKYCNFYNKNMLLKNTNGNYFVCEFDKEYDKKRKNVDYKIKNMIKIGCFNDFFAKSVGLNDNEFIEITVASKEDFSMLSDDNFNKKLGIEIFIFDNGTKTRIVWF